MPALEKHFTIPEIAKLWQLSDDKVRLIFRDRPGVLRIGRRESMHRRGYVTLRIPQSVLEKVHAELHKAAA